MKKKKQKKWIKLRHKIVQNVAYCLLYPYIKLKFHEKSEKFKDEGKRQYLVVYNHQTAFDMFFVAMCFKQRMYYVASEDIFSLGFVSKLLSYLVAPIPIKKQTADVSAVLNCMKVVKEGGSIVLAPEGNRTYSGRTGYFKPSIVSLARALKLPVAVCRIEDGYGVQPRWTDKLRRGKMRTRVAEVIEYDTYSKLSDDEFYSLLKDALYVDEYKSDGKFYSKRSAEYIERLLYVCPECGLTEFSSSGETFRCKSCGLTVRYMPDKTLSAERGALPFRNTGEWYDYQNAFINKLDPLQYTDKPMYRENVKLYEEIVYKKKRPIDENCEISLFGDRIEVAYSHGGAEVYPFSEVSVVTVLGRNKLNFYHGGKVYQAKGDKRFCAIKYMNVYFRHKNLNSEVENGEFLGI